MVWSGRGVDTVMMVLIMLMANMGGGNVTFANNSQIEHFFTFHRNAAAAFLACLFIQFGMHAYMDICIWLLRSIESFLRSLSTSTSDVHTFLLLRISLSLLQFLQPKLIVRYIGWKMYLDIVLDTAQKMLPAQRKPNQQHQQRQQQQQ